MSSSTSAAAFGTHSQQLQHEPCAQGKASGCGGCGCGSAPTEGMTDAQKRDALDRGYKAMRNAFLDWHRSGCMTGAAAYTGARRTWEAMLMKWGDV